MGVVKIMHKKRIYAIDMMQVVLVLVADMVILAVKIAMLTVVVKIIHAAHPVKLII